MPQSTFVSCRACERKSGNWLHKGRYGEWLALHQVLAGSVTQLVIHAWDHYYTVSSGVTYTLERRLLDFKLGLNTKKIIETRKYKTLKM